MSRILPLLIMCLCAATVMAGDAIRSLPLPTIMDLGKELYQRDKIASDGYDALFAAHPEARKLPLRGWITQYDKTIRRVFFIQGPDDAHLSLAYTLTFLPDNSPRIEEERGEPLPPMVAKRYSARQAAIAAIPSFAPGRNYNFEVLDDPENKGGFIVYGLASTTDPDEVVIGGHYRVTISDDGKTVKQVDALSRSFLVMKENEGIPKGSKSVAMVVSHVVSDTPVETHVYVSLLRKKPLYVGTSEHDVWKVEEGIITKVEPAKAEPKTESKK